MRLAIKRAAPPALMLKPAPAVALAPIAAAFASLRYPCFSYDDSLDVNVWDMTALYT